VALTRALASLGKYWPSDGVLDSECRQPSGIWAAPCAPAAAIKPHPALHLRRHDRSSRPGRVSRSVGRGPGYRTLIAAMIGPRGNQGGQIDALRFSICGVNRWRQLAASSPETARIVDIFGPVPVPVDLKHEVGPHIRFSPPLAPSSYSRNRKVGNAAQRRGHPRSTRGRAVDLVRPARAACRSSQQEGFVPW